MGAHAFPHCPNSFVTDDIGGCLLVWPCLMKRGKQDEAIGEHAEKVDISGGCGVTVRWFRCRWWNRERPGCRRCLLRRCPRSCRWDSYGTDRDFVEPEKRGERHTHQHQSRRQCCHWHGGDRDLQPANGSGNG